MMASAKEQSLLGKGNDFLDEDLTYCQPCIVQGKKVSATKFCVDCNEYLCKECTTYHKALTATKDHVHVKPDEAKTAPLTAAKDKCSNKCPGHKDKHVKYYCEAHSYLGCSVCFTIDHKPCRDVEHIPTVAASLNGHSGFKQFDDTLKNLDVAFKTSIADIQNNLKLLQADERQVQQVFKDFRKQMNDALNKMESQISTEVKNIKDKEVKKLDAMLKKLEKSKTSVDVLVKDLDNLMTTGKHCDAYVMVRTDLGQLTRLQEELARTTRGQTFQRFVFQPRTDLLKVGALGKLNITSDGVRPVSSWSAAPPSDPKKTPAAPLSALKKTPAAPPSAAVSASKVNKTNEYWRAMGGRIKKGDRVRRGWDWCDGDEDGGPGALGIVTRVWNAIGGRICDVQWDNGHTGGYWMNDRKGYELEVV